MEVKQIVIWICEACLRGEGQECHTAGCALFLHSVDLPIQPDLYTQIGGFIDSDGDQWRKITWTPRDKGYEQ